MICFYDSLGDKHPLQHAISNYCLTRKNDGNNVLSFNLDSDSDEYKLISNETVIDDGENQYLVKKINGTKFECSLDLDFLKSTVYASYNSGSKTLAETLRAHLPAGWSINGANVRSIKRTIEFDYCTDYDIIQQCMDTYDVCFVWNTVVTTLTVVDTDSIQPSGEYLTDELNLRKVSYKSETTNFITRLYAYGEDGMTFASINGGNEYVENFTYSTKIICGYWSDNRYTVKENLLEAAKNKLEELCMPVTTYECDVIDIAKQKPEEYSFLDFQLHKVVTLIDRDRGVKVNHHIVQYKEYPDEPDRNVITLSAVPETIVSSMQKISNDLIDTIGESKWTLEKAVQHATEKIAYELEGHVYIRHNEILIMDTEDPNTAKGLWRWTYGGLGFSSTGYTGTYAVALTNDGQIVADRITAGELNGVILKAGSVQADALSQAFKESIQDDINNTHTTIIQEFTAADNAVKSVISAATSKYSTEDYDIGLFGYGSPDEQGYDASKYSGKYYLDQETGLLYKSNGVRWNKEDELELITTAMSSSFTQTVSEIRGEIAEAQTNAETNANTYTDSKIVQTSTSIKSTVSSAMDKYNTTGKTINYKGFGTPSSQGYSASDYNGKYYLNMNNGYLYLSDGTSWTKTETLSKISTNLQSQITQNAENITLKVSSGDVVSEINQSSDTISLKAGRLVITTGNFKLDSSGTATMVNAVITGSLKTTDSDNDYYTYIHSGIVEFFYSSKRIAYLIPVGSSSGIHQFSILGSGNYDGVAIGAKYDNATYTYYRCNIGDAYTSEGCRHRFVGTVKFDNKFQTSVNFEDNIGCAWGGNVGLRYWSDSPTYGNGLYLGITANSCNTYVVGNSITMRCDTWVQNSNLYVRSGYLDVDDSYGIRCTGTIAFRWVNGSGLFVGIDTQSLKLVGSNIYANGSPVATSSDERKKTDIASLDERYLKMIKAIYPVSFKYSENISLSGRTHTGFIAQDVLNAMEEAGITSQDFAGFVDVDGDGQDYALRYEEFISPLLMYIKHLESRIDALERTG